MKKVLSLVLALCMLLGIGSALAEEPYGGIDLSTPVVLTMYFTGNDAADWTRINDLVNEKLAEKVNTTINFVQVSFADFMSSYSLFLAGGEDIDLLYCQPTNNYASFAAAGSFEPLSEEFLKTYMPLTWENEMPSLWAEATVNGTIYGVPANSISGSYNGIVTSRALMDKYGFKESDITNLEQLTAYLKAVAAGEQGTGVYALNCQSGFPSDWLMIKAMGHFFEVNAGSAHWFMWDYAGKDAFNVDEMIWYADSDTFMEWALLMADWYKSGIYPADVASNETTIEAAQRAGTTAINFSEPAYALTLSEFYKVRDDELVFLDCLTDEDTRVLGVSRGHSIVFPTGSKNMERAAIVADLLKNDPEIYLLMQGGVEGEHYVLSEDGAYHSAGPKAEAYPWGNRCFFLANSSEPQLKLNDYLQPFQDKIAPIMVDSSFFPVSGFNYDNAKYEAELAGMNSIMNEYRFAFCFGLYGDDTEAKVNEYRELMHASGIDDVLADYKEQVKAYLGE